MSFKENGSRLIGRLINGRKKRRILVSAVHETGKSVTVYIFYFIPFSILLRARLRTTSARVYYARATIEFPYTLHARASGADEYFKIATRRVSFNDDVKKKKIRKT
jgi:hypothetical protein